MKKNTIFSLLIMMSLCLFGYDNLQAQGFLQEVSLKHQIEKSELVVEGKVISKTSTWDDERRLIYTINTVEVYKVFKGELIETVDVITEGGTVGLRALIVHPSLSLYNGDIGVFTLSNNTSKIATAGKSTVKKFKPYGLSQGFYRYNLREDLASNPFKKKIGISDAFYNEIKQYAKQKVVEVKSFNVIREIAKSTASKSLLPPGPITLVNPTVTAGTKDQLTITGTNFGGSSQQGKVWFRNADDGGTSYIPALDTEVVSWSDTQIIVEVPSKAGTGTIFVEDSSGDTSPDSPTPLTVLYAEINVQFDLGSGFNAYQVRHVDEDSNGGYIWEMHTDFFNETEPDPHNAGMIMPTGYKAAFMRAFNKWVCETGINWEVSGTATTVDIVGNDLGGSPDPDEGDGPNVIRFDNGSELADTTLGKCFSWYLSCDGMNWFVDETDIVFNNSVDSDQTPGTTETWYFGTGIPSASQYDFESVALHELGHGHQLGHVIDPVDNGNDLDDVMHWNLFNGESQKELTANNSTAANGIQTRSTTSPSVCGESVMTDASCPLSVEEESLNKAVSIYPNPASDTFFINNESIIPIERAEIYDVSGRLISTNDLINGSKLKTIKVLNASSGLYFVKVYSSTASITRKLILE